MSVMNKRSSQQTQTLPSEEDCQKVPRGAILSIRNFSSLRISTEHPNQIMPIFETSPRVGQALLQQLVRTDTGAEGATKGRKQNRNKSKSWKIGEIKYKQNITCWNCNQKGHFQNQCSKLVASKDKVVSMAAGDSDDALVCCVENTVEDRIMDSGASFHATYCKEELERFKLRSGKVRLADDKTLDIAGIGDIVLKTSFDTSWTLRDDSLVVARGNKRGSLYMVEVHPEGIGAIIDGRGSAAHQRIGDMTRIDMKMWFGEAEEGFLHNVRKDKETVETATGVTNGIVMLKMVPETPLQFGVAERLSRTFRAESTGLRAEAPKMLWADAVNTTYLIYHIPYVLIGLRILAEEWRWKNTSLAHLKSQGGSSDTSEGSKNSGSFEDSGRLDEEDSEDEASSNEGGFETRHVRRSSRDSRAPVRVKEEHDGRKRYKARLVVEGFQQIHRVDYNEIFSPVVKMTTIRLVLSIVAFEDLHLEQLDVKTAFLHGDLDEYFYMTQPEDFHSAGKEENLFYAEGKVDDMLVAGFDMAEFNKPKWLLPLVFEMKDRCSEKQVIGYVLIIGVTTVERDWSKLVWILISKGSLSLLKILGTKSLAEMFTRLVMKEKLKFCTASTSLRVN
ncbi:retrovirus-related pol polyprotein from transposon TNT 1-94 [Tanacetum coccineum]